MLLLVSQTTAIADFFNVNVEYRLMESNLLKLERTWADLQKRTINVLNGD